MTAPTADDGRRPAQDAGPGISYESARESVLAEIATALARIEPEAVQAYVRELLRAEKIFFTGVGRVALSLQASVKRYCHLGLRCWWVGDLNEPAVTERDLLVVASGSGESVVPVAIARVAKRHGARVVHIGSNAQSSLEPLTDLLVRIPVRTRLHRPDELASSQIMTSLFEQSLFVLGDIVALLLMEAKGLQNLDDLWQVHANLE